MNLPKKSASSQASPGDPNKPADIDESSGEARLTPRTSFALWREAAHGRSQPWSEFEKQCAETLGQMAAGRIPSEAGPAKPPVDRDKVDGAAPLLPDPRGQAHGADAFAEERKIHKDKLAEIERIQLETVLKLTRRLDDLIELLYVYQRDGHR